MNTDNPKFKRSKVDGTSQNPECDSVRDFSLSLICVFGILKVKGQWQKTIPLRENESYAIVFPELTGLLEDLII